MILEYAFSNVLMHCQCQWGQITVEDWGMDMTRRALTFERASLRSTA